MKKLLALILAIIIIVVPAWSKERGAILFYDSPFAFVDNERVLMPAPVTVVNGQAMVPLDFMANLTGSKVSYDNGYIWIHHKDKPEVYFDRSAEKPLRDLIKTAKTEIYIELYWLSRENVITDLIDACKKGVKLHAILDNHKTNYANGQRLKNAGAEVEYDWKTRDYHRKLAVFDGQYVWMGSTNWTDDGFESNAEVDFLFDDTDLATDLLEQMYLDLAEARMHKHQLQ